MTWDDTKAQLGRIKQQSSLTSTWGGDIVGPRILDLATLALPGLELSGLSGPRLRTTRWGGLTASWRGFWHVVLEFCPTRSGRPMITASREGLLDKYSSSCMRDIAAKILSLVDDVERCDVCGVDEGLMGLVCVGCMACVGGFYDLG